MKHLSANLLEAKTAAASSSSSGKEIPGDKPKLTDRDPKVVKTIDRLHEYRATDSLAKRVMKRIGQGFFWTVVGVIVVVAVLVFVIPQAKAGAGLTVLTGSMKPAINPGDVVAVRGIKAHEVCDTLNPGDIVTFMPYEDNDMLVTHRVVSVDRDPTGGPGTAGEDRKYEYCLVTTQGDSNNVADTPVPARAIKAVHMYTVPKVGYVLNAAQNYTSMRAMSIGASVLFFAAASYFLINRRSPVSRHSHVAWSGSLDAGAPTWDTLATWSTDDVDYGTTRFAVEVPVLTAGTLCDYVLGTDGCSVTVLDTGDRRPMGYAVMSDDGELVRRVGLLVVDPEHREVGWGHCLLDHVLHEAFMADVEFVVAEHAWSDTPGAKLFDDAGFTYERVLADDTFARRTLTRQTWLARQLTTMEPEPITASPVDGGGCQPTSPAGGPRSGSVGATLKVVVPPVEPGAAPVETTIAHPEAW
ncbi:MAG: signal peptidase I [Promicromonosporaceae bacterium]|nr:signal peptidase I [Promicromonosporaceae bacterium]